LLVAALWPALPCAAARSDAAAAPSPRADAASIVAGLRREAPARTPYIEVRFSGLLERPLILRGELEYLGPGKLGRRVDSPYNEQTTVSDGTATVRRGERAPRTFSLGQAPELDGFLRGFAALLGGDAATLARDFELSVNGTRKSWQLLLKPRDRRLARRINSIQVDGVENTPHCFRTRDSDGDVNVMLIETLAATKLPTRPSQPLVDALCRGFKVP
jgi:hypothetical protein